MSVAVGSLLANNLALTPPFILGAIIGIQLSFLASLLRRERIDELVNAHRGVKCQHTDGDNGEIKPTRNRAMENSRRIYQSWRPLNDRAVRIGVYCRHSEIIQVLGGSWFFYHKLFHTMAGRPLKAHPSTLYA